MERKSSKTFSSPYAKTRGNPATQGSQQISQLAYLMIQLIMMTGILFFFIFQEHLTHVCLQNIL